MTNLEATRKTLKKHCPDVDVDSCTFTGENDPGQWAPHAEVVIHCKTGLPDGGSSFWMSEPLVDDLAVSGLWAETINGAVVAIFLF